MHHLVAPVGHIAFAPRVTAAISPLRSPCKRFARRRLFHRSFQFRRALARHVYASRGRQDLGQKESMMKIGIHL